MVQNGAGRLLIRALLVLCTLTWWLFPGFGVIDLTVTWDPEWPVMLEAGWGVLFTVGVGLPFLVSYSWPGEYGGFSAGWSVAVMLWAAAVLAATWGAGLRRKAKRS